MTNIVHQPVSGAAHPGLVEDCALCAARRGPATPDVDPDDIWVNPDLPAEAVKALRGKLSGWGFSLSTFEATEALAAAMLAIRRHIADEIRAMPRRNENQGWPAYDEAAVNFNVALEFAESAVRGEPLRARAPRPERPIPQRDFTALEAGAEPYEPQVHRSKPVRPRPNPGGSDA